MLMDDRTWVMNAMQEGKVDLAGQFVLGSNYTFLTRVTFEGRSLDTVYKPSRGEQELWDFPPKSLAKREVAAFLVSEFLGWDLVPLTIYRRQRVPLGPGSLQQYIEHDPNYYFFNFSDSDRQRLRPVAVFDLLINNADRKGGHLIKDPSGHLWSIDHGVCFHHEDKLRTILWDYIGEEISAELIRNIECLAEELEAQGEIYQNLRKFLRVGEIKALLRRARSLAFHPFFPEPEKGRRPYPWPLV
jgi:hypothetical protein